MSERDFKWDITVCVLEFSIGINIISIFSWQIVLYLAGFLIFFSKEKRIPKERQIKLRDVSAIEHPLFLQRPQIQVQELIWQFAAICNYSCR